MEEERKALFNKLLELENRLRDVTTMKKIAAKDYREQITDIKGEITEIVEKLGE